MKITIGKPNVVDNGDSCRLSVIVSTPDEKFPLWYEVERDYGKYLCYERADAFLVAILPWAMMKAKKNREKVDLVFEQGVSEKLHHQLVQYFIPVLCKHIDYYASVTISAVLTSEKLEGVSAVGTGISGGVDSSYTVAKYVQNTNEHLKLSHGVFYNIGIYGGYDSDSEKHLESRARNIASETGLKYLTVTSNTCIDLYKMAHAPIVPFVFMAGALALQKLFSVYYYSSGFSAEDFHISDIDAAYFDLLSVCCFSTNDITFYSSGIEASRLEKVAFISEYPFTYNNLSVCLSEAQGKGNCGRCAKCTRTMAELETIGKLQNYKNVFDVANFYRHPIYHWGYILLKSKTDSFCKEIVAEYRKRGGKIPTVAYLGSLQKWISRGFTSVNRKRKKVNE